MKNNQTQKTNNNGYIKNCIVILKGGSEILNIHFENDTNIYCHTTIGDQDMETIIQILNKYTTISGLKNNQPDTD